VAARPSASAKQPDVVFRSVLAGPSRSDQIAKTLSERDMRKAFGTKSIASPRGYCVIVNKSAALPAADFVNDHTRSRSVGTR
jgi:hypothetical protein